MYLIRGLVNIALDHLFCIAFAYADIVLYIPFCVFCSVAVFLLANIRDSYKLWLCISAVVSGDFDSLILDRFCFYSGAYW